MLLAGNCIMSTTKENDLIYDPYMGSGTTALACLEYNRNFIGSELNKEYCDMANNRLKNKLLQPKLF
jgi:DNA modification methylase